MKIIPIQTYEKQIIIKNFMNVNGELLLAFLIFHSTTKTSQLHKCQNGQGYINKKSLINLKISARADGGPRSPPAHA